jgi:hypothetical protein
MDGTSYDNRHGYGGTLLIENILRDNSPQFQQLKHLDLRVPRLTLANISETRGFELEMPSLITINLEEMIFGAKKLPSLLKYIRNLPKFKADRRLERNKRTTSVSLKTVMLEDSGDLKSFLEVLKELEGLSGSIQFNIGIRARSFCAKMRKFIKEFHKKLDLRVGFFTDGRDMDRESFEDIKYEVERKFSNIKISHTEDTEGDYEEYLFFWDEENQDSEPDSDEDGYIDYVQKEEEEDDEHDDEEEQYEDGEDEESENGEESDKFEEEEVDNEWEKFDYLGETFPLESCSEGQGEENDDDEEEEGADEESDMENIDSRDHRIFLREYEEEVDGEEGTYENFLVDKYEW